jgi:hypothetical protein
MKSLHPVRGFNYQKVEFVGLSHQILMIQMLVLWLDLLFLRNLNVKAKCQFAGNLKFEFDQKVVAATIGIVLLGNHLDFVACQMVLTRQEATITTQKYFKREVVVTVQKVIMFANQGILKCLIIP